MLSFIAEFFDLDRYLNIGVDVGVYFFLAAVSTLLFLIRLGMQLILGVDDGGDFDFETGDMDAHLDSTGAFTLFSLLSILAFFMGVGWMGLTCRMSWGMGPVPSAFAASGFGIVLMLMSAGLMYGVRKLSLEASADIQTAVGRTARVYLTIPERGQGGGQIEVDVDGSRKIMNAVSTGPAIPAFATVKVLEVRDDGTLIVEVA